MSDSYVIDASVGIKLFVEEPDSAAADALFSLLAESPKARFYVPDLFFPECASILWKYVRLHGYPREDAQVALFTLQALALREVATPGLVERIFQTAIQEQITIYDASYVTLSAELGLPFITADEKLARKLHNGRHDVRLLSDLVS